MFRHFSIFTLLFALLTFTACDPEEDITPENDLSENFPDGPPEFPSADMYLLPITDFTQPGIDTTHNGKRVNGINSYRNWSTSALSLTALQLGMLAESAVPLAIFYQAAVEGVEEELEDGSYQWTYQHETRGKTYDVVVKGQYIEIPFLGIPLGVDMKMFVSEQGGFQDFEWFNATFSIGEPQNMGEFTVYKNPESPVSAVNISFGLSDDLDGISLRYTWMAPLANPTSIGSVLEFQQTPNTDGYDRAFIFSVEDLSGNPFEVQWNSTTREGRIRDESTFGSYEWNCWNESLRDEECK